MAKKKKPVRDDSRGPSFEESLGELEAIVGELETGKLGLSDALARYEEGVAHFKSCREQLERAERKIELLTGVDAEGRPISEPFDDQELELEDKAAARGRRRTSGGKPSAGKRSSADIDDTHRLF